jgi:hypothetical protein
MRGTVVSHESNLCRVTYLPESRGSEPAVSDGFTTGRKVERLIARSKFQPAEHGR